jgi:peptidoglycan/LPS O-acetylase OafA/YrhL
MLLHAYGYFPDGFGLPRRIAEILIQNAYYGVVMFFVISGFLITGRLADFISSFSVPDIGRFYAARFGRIFPCFALALVVLATASMWGLDKLYATSPSSIPALLLNALTLRANVPLAYTHQVVGGGWDVLWSLSIEEAFYLFFPLLVLLFRNQTGLLLFLLAVAVLGPIYRFAIGSHHQFYGVFHYLGAVDLIAIGCSTRLLIPARIGSASTRIIMLVGTVVCVVNYFSISVRYNFVLGPTITALGTALMLLASAFLVDSGKRGMLTMFGRLSYELYLFHVIIVITLFSLVQPFRQIPFIWLGIYLVACGVFAGGLSHCFSEPANRFIRRVAFGSRLRGTAKHPELSRSSQPHVGEVGHHGPYETPGRFQISAGALGPRGLRRQPGGTPGRSSG